MPAGRKIAFAITLAAISIHLWRTPIYDMDFIGYAGNALLFRTQDVTEVHRLVYAEIRALPNAGTLMGESGDPEAAPSRRIRAQNPGNFAQFLPCFAIRPAYNFLLFVLSPLGLARASLLISVASYFLLGWLVFTWTDEALLSMLVMLLPPVLGVGRSTMSDAPSILCALVGLYLLFAKRNLLLGFLVLFGSLFLRTDNIVWIAPVLIILWWKGALKLAQSIVLGVTAVLCVLSINHFAGDYGIGMLYYREFLATPLAPAEMTVHLTVHEYLLLFRSGLSQAVGSLLIPFLIFGLLSSRKSWALVALGLGGIVLHFVILPDFRQERHFLVGYVLLTIPLLIVDKDLVRNIRNGVGWQS